MSKLFEKTIEIFKEINNVPRCSKNEQQISDWLVSWAKSHNFDVKRDEALNVLISVEATKGFEDKQTLVLQGHMDMVCEKTPDSNHDFSKDAVKCLVDGDWMHADKTTLGADNGIALAMALAIAEDKSLKHPPLELLFTVDEETGLTGANFVAPNWFKGKILLNLDSEDEGIFTVGCAGGKDTKIDFGVKRESFAGKVLELKVGGLLGGHSGVDVNTGRGNANIILARLLKNLSEKYDLRIVSISGGSAHNAIPRDASSVVVVNGDVEKDVKNFEKIVQKELHQIEKNLFISSKECDADFEPLTKNDTENFIEFMLAMPNGVAAMSLDIKGLVETSNNFATIKTSKSGFEILSSQRSSVMSKLDWITKKIEAVAKLSGVKFESGNGYPSWEPNMDSDILKQCLKVYKELFNKEPIVETIHAGLECGIIGAKNEGMEMISFGPTIVAPHSPDEKMHLPSLEKTLDFTVKLLESYCE